MAEPFSLTLLELCWHNYCFKVYKLLTCLCNHLSTTGIAQTKNGNIPISRVALKKVSKKAVFFSSSPINNNAFYLLIKSIRLQYFMPCK